MTWSWRHAVTLAVLIYTGYRIEITGGLPEVILVFLALFLLSYDSYHAGLEEGKSK